MVNKQVKSCPVLCGTWHDMGYFLLQKEGKGAYKKNMLRAFHFSFTGKVTAIDAAHKTDNAIDIVLKQDG